MMTEKERARFNSKWTKKGSCHVWTEPLDRDGYGTFHLRRFNRRAHRVAYWDVHGTIPEGYVVNHICRNRSCVNHQHLNILTVRENSMRDSASPTYLNSQKTHCKNGHPFDKKYGKQRYCSRCEVQKQIRLREKWKLTKERI